MSRPPGPGCGCVTVTSMTNRGLLAGAHPTSEATVPLVRFKPCAAGSSIVAVRSEEHTSEPSHVEISYAVFCLKKKKNKKNKTSKNRRKSAPSTSHTLKTRNPQH